MSKRANKLQPLASLAKQNEHSAARLHGSVLNELKKQETQLEELITYRDQYLESFSSAGRTGLSAIQLQDYRVFLRRLDDAIQQQKQLVTNGLNESETSKQHWLEKRNKSKMVNKVVDSRKQKAIKHKQRLEQRELEDRPQVKMY